MTKGDWNTYDGEDGGEQAARDRDRAREEDTGVATMTSCEAFGHVYEATGVMGATAEIYRCNDCGDEIEQEAEEG